MKNENLNNQEELFRMCTYQVAYLKAQRARTCENERGERERERGRERLRYFAETPAPTLSYRLSPAWS